MHNYDQLKVLQIAIPAEQKNSWYNGMILLIALIFKNNRIIFNHFNILNDLQTICPLHTWSQNQFAWFMFELQGNEKPEMDDGLIIFIDLGSQS